jgi:hypothetical protein
VLARQRGRLWIELLLARQPVWVGVDCTVCSGISCIWDMRCWCCHGLHPVQGLMQHSLHSWLCNIMAALPALLDAQNQLVDHHGTIPVSRLRCAGVTKDNTSTECEHRTSRAPPASTTVIVPTCQQLNSTTHPVCKLRQLRHMQIVSSNACRTGCNSGSTELNIDSKVLTQDCQQWLPRSW